MDATRRVACNPEIFNPVLTMGMQVSFILVLSHFFQLMLKPLGQAGPVAQILVSMSPNTHMKYVVFYNVNVNVCIYMYI